MAYGDERPAIPTKAEYVPGDDEQAALDRLEGLRCAKCGSDAPFRVGITGSVFDSGCWDDETDIECAACGHTGVVADFRNKEGGTA